MKAGTITAGSARRAPANGRRLPGWLAAALVLVCASAGAQDVKDGGPFVPTPQKVVEAMLDLAAVRPKDFVMDLGSGDGRIVLTAATRHKAGGVGVDIDQELVDRANASARRLGVADRVKFIKQDVQQADLSRATVLTLYLLPGMMTTLRPKFLKELKPGTRIVSHDFELGEWKPDRTIEVETPEKYDLSGAWTSNVHLWIVPASVQGTWRGALAGENGTRLQFELSQSFQRIDGRLARDGRRLALREGVVEGRIVRFSVARAGGGTDTFVATVDGDRMRGEIRGEGPGSKWTAERTRQESAGARP